MGEIDTDLTPGEMPEPNARGVLVYAVFFGLLGGFGEAARAVGASVWSHQASGDVVSPEVFWMAPLAASLTLLLVGALLVGIERLLGRIRIHHLAPPILAGIGVFSFGRSLALGLHPLALGVLAAGAGALVGRTLARRPETWRGISRRMAVFGTLAALAWAGWVPQARRLAERRALADLPTASADAPNILLIVWDTVRAMSLSLYGHDRETTPTLERLASSAVVFDRAISSAPWTLPSHATLFTGLYEHEHGATRGSPLGESVPTLAEALSARGYRTGGFAANTYWLGRAFGLHRGFQWYEESWFEDAGGDSWPVVEGIARSWWLSNAVYRSTGSQARRRRRVQNVPAGMVSDAFLSWLDRGSSDRPFFGFLNLYDAHEPYVAREPTGFRFSNGEPRYWWDYTRPDTISAADFAQLREAYDATIFHLDFRLGELLDALDQRGALDHTVVIVTSDHGETLGEHGPDRIGHSKYAYPEVLNVPLVFYYPARFRGGTRHSMPVSLVDVAATVLDLAGEHGSAPDLPGISLVPLLEAAAGEGSDLSLNAAFSQATPADWQLEFPRWPVASGPLFSLFDGDAQYVVNALGDEELYDLATDPGAARNLVGNDVEQPVLDALRRRARDIVESNRGPGGR